MTASRPDDLFDLGGRVALVTGASSGLGAAVARALAGAGATVAVSARRKDRLDDLAAAIGAVPLACDLMDPDQLDALVPAVATECGEPEILVNVAGHIVESRPAEDEPLDMVRDTLNVLLKFEEDVEAAGIQVPAFVHQALKDAEAGL